MNRDQFSFILEGVLPNSLTAEQKAALFTHFEFLQRWNARMNLTSIRDPEEIVLRHYCESIFFALNVPEEKTVVSVADIGSGAGFPGVALAVLRPAWAVTLVEANRRKAVFLRESTRHLNNIQIETRRAESLPGFFDWLISRAVNFQDVLALIPNLSCLVGLLTTQEIFNGISLETRSTWNPPVCVPWDHHRICCYGRFT